VPGRRATQESLGGGRAHRLLASACCCCSFVGVLGWTLGHRRARGGSGVGGWVLGSGTVGSAAEVGLEVGL